MSQARTMEKSVQLALGFGIGALIALLTAFLLILLTDQLFTTSPTPTPTAPALEWMKKYGINEYRDFDKYVTVNDPEIRNTALTIVRDVPVERDVISETVKVDAGSHRAYFKICEQGTVLKGLVYTSQYDFNFYLMDYEDYLNFVRGGTFNFYVGASARRVQSYQFNFVIPKTGIYCLVIDNTFSLFTPKYVTIHVEATYEPAIDVNSPVWKIWKINYWVAKNIRYVSDPIGREYIASASETLRARAGDCEDFAILLASMYEAVGLDSAIALLDTNGDGKVDHASALVYYKGTAKDFLEEEEMIMNKLGLQSPTERYLIAYFRAESIKGTVRSYTTGIWIPVDPLFSEFKELAGYITHEPYEPIIVIDVG